MPPRRRPGRVHVAVPAVVAAWALLAGPSLLGGSVAPAEAQDVATGAPTASWPLDDTTPGLARDTAGGHDGVATGGVATGRVAQGPSTTATGFDGTGVIEAPAAGLAPGTVAATAWLRIPRTTTAGTVVDTGGLRLGLHAGRPAVLTCAAGGSCAGTVGPARLLDGAWHQVAASVTGSRQTLYVDGVAVAGGTTPGADAVPADGRVAIGRRLRGDVDRVSLYAQPLSAEAVAAEFRRGACPQGAGAAVPASARRSLPALPLRTRGRYIVDAAGKRVKWAGVNWYGAEELDNAPAGLQCEPVDALASRIVTGGFNVVRLPWATDTWVGPAPAVPPVAVAANPQLTGLDARGVFDAVVAALGRHGLMVVLDNHVGRSDWCCSGDDGNALWWQAYDPAHPPAWARMTRNQRLAYFRRMNARWLSAWRAVASRYAPGSPTRHRAVVAVDLRNEPRGDALLHIAPRWDAGRSPVWQDWPRAATAAGNAVLRVNPRLLVAVEGTSYATNLRGVATRPIRLARPHRVVYSAHDYVFTHPGLRTPNELRTQLGQWWGWLLTRHRSWTAPVWVGEFGTCHPEEQGCPTSTWWPAFLRYLHDGDLDWTYWSFAGTGARGSAEPQACAQTLRFPGCPEGYGLSDPTWSRDASPRLSDALRSVTRQTQGP